MIEAFELYDPKPQVLPTVNLASSLPPQAQSDTPLNIQVSPSKTTANICFDAIQELSRPGPRPSHVDNRRTTR
ncbi:unnamed protein product [Cuscuta europaea]|uniref:Uncharacterized protein n=1 Tax=Cuscuta europaea TaxID=41803 RepID=A0A9P1DXI8_CUSEU|nr:unnamed protein product [Cuscuta europaea]